jgi:hypothetical protein
MSAQLFIQPSLFGDFAFASGQWSRGIPTPGLAGPFVPGVPAVGGVPDCKDLLAASPPTLLEEYEIYSYSIGWGIFLEWVGADIPTPVADIELALLVNDRVQYVTSTPVVLAEVASGAGIDAWVGSDSWVSDLVNPIRLGGRERLGLRLGIKASEQLAQRVAVVGTQIAFSGGFPIPVPFESTISYNTIQVPASRRL